ncbi:uncharacterized protein BT62DRAFT_1034594 [Guyanagaster necrorhizus]|uniref:Fe2OG dioxygenase domain-containing protein n=1 Tax=Guyanagaster necrorhizus TaxID=856835 RepID=A0A9P7VMU7_9AGAR|nr:uncharacterized protein BT62DRAFT_1034594 [Guyanagaster necrorhizus MCA 3950]KAG7443220.1 hypothetical protein BT62DRAFT_1034594 [Guyanagaster necrorhizus MCA 3950]
MSFDLQKYSVRGCDGLYYVPDFVTVSWAVVLRFETLTRRIKESPRQKWKQLANRRFVLAYHLMSPPPPIWQITPKNILVSQPLPSFVNKFPDIVSRLKDTGAFKSSPHGEPNHIILNEYLPGQGIMPHEDGPAYHPIVATISLGSHAVFHYYRYTPEKNGMTNGRAIDNTPALSVLLEPRSVIITTEALYKEYLHGIEDIETDTIRAADTTTQESEFTDTNTPVQNFHLLTSEKAVRAVSEGGSLQRDVRYSLTCRDVERVRDGSFIRT